MVEEDGEASISIPEFMQAELEADLVLGGDEGKECTYRKGYMVRQAVFTCITCTPEGSAGFCTACSITCHDGHEVIELWTKRNFRCDCGNSRFGGLECKLCQEKDSENKENVYNQNYFGKYCSCHRPYPDSHPEEDAGEMLQCCICEDWFHESHLGLSPEEEVPNDEENESLFEALICKDCISRCDFLAHYPELFVAPASADDGNEAEAVVPADPVGVPETPNPGPVNGLTCRLKKKPVEEKLAVGIENGTHEELVEEGKVEAAFERPSLDTDKSVFMCKSWRDHLCRCAECLALYKSRSLDFLLVKGDSIPEYEEAAAEKRRKKQEIDEGAQLAFMQTLGHVQQMELLHGLDDMRTTLMSYLAPIAEAGRTVTSNDIYDCFEQLNKRRKRNL